ncbi:hypothetical protein ACERII_06350 [Evansella sp. AB-rgal1]|uniref:hypothetical protein n=1 Tax=Evansella sp. AB-rgal1 TaxID=3242696 RepID=UPI00359DC79A
MKKVLFLLLASVIVIFASCNTDSNGVNNVNESVESLNLTTEVEVIDGDFVYRLVTEKDEYEEHGDVTIYAELEYIGEKDNITINHAASPFYFDIHEITRNYTIHHAVDTPLFSTILHKGEPYREVYIKAGGYSEHDEDDYIQFLIEFWDYGFPTGEYVVEGVADFFTEDNENVNHLIEGKISFTVVE